jgi:hypothetical protein
MTPQRRLIGHARDLRTILRSVGAVYCLVLLVNVWDADWLLAALSAVVLACCVTGARNVTKTLEKLL